MICDVRDITCTQTIANMVVVDDRSMTNVRVVDNTYVGRHGRYMAICMHSFHRAWLVNELSHMTLTWNTES